MLLGDSLCRFFSSIESLDTFTYSLPCSLSSKDACQHCKKNNQWVSHGYTYKKAPHHQRISGKRIVCSNRYGKSGCGRTRQLYLADVIPRRRYTLSVIITFIRALLANNTVEGSYLLAIQATGIETRHAWRWLRDLFKQLPRWRSCLPLGHERFIPCRSSRTRQHLLPTLERLIHSFHQHGIERVQLTHQREFF